MLQQEWMRKEKEKRMKERVPKIGYSATSQKIRELHEQNKGLGYSIDTIPVDKYDPIMSIDPEKGFEDFEEPQTFKKAKSKRKKQMEKKEDQINEDRNAKKVYNPET